MNRRKFLFSTSVITLSSVGFNARKLSGSAIAAEININSNNAIIDINFDDSTAILLNFEKFNVMAQSINKNNLNISIKTG